MTRRARYELKYVVEESRARAITGFLRSYLRPSVYNRSGSIAGEPVCSLYFDSPDLLFYRQNSAGLKNRIKLRIRFYDSDWERPAFLEIKRRVNETICKARTMISRDVVRQMLCRQWASPSGGASAGSVDYGSRQIEVQQQFAYLQAVARARPLLYVSYIREAFVAVDDGPLRVTFDRQLRATLYEGEDRLTVPSRGNPPHTRSLPPESVVLELKFNRACPQWMQKMVRVFNLHRRSLCKYTICADALGLAGGRVSLAAAPKGIVA